jgi:hypothetical protein
MAMLQVKPQAPIGLVCVLDLEVKPDPQAVALAVARGSRMRPGLQMITAITMLSVEEDATGAWMGHRLRSFGLPDPEFELLMQLDEALAEFEERSPLLVTYNGIAHDLGVLRHRGARHWLFGLPGLDLLDRCQHRDMMRTGTRGWRDAWPTLRDALAGLGIAADPMVASGASRSVEAAVRKCEVDVVGTYLLLLYELAIERGDPAVLVSGWSALSDYLGRPPVAAPHLNQFRRNPMLREARRLASEAGS